MLVAVVVQAVEEARALFGQQALAVKQGGGGLERVVLATAKDIVEDEAEEPVVGPLSALDEEDLARGEEDDPTRRVRLAEDATGDDVRPGLPEERLRRGRLAMVLGRMRLEGKRVLIIAGRVVGSEHEETGGAALAPGEEHRHFVAVVEDVVVGFMLVTKGSQELAEPSALACDPRLVPALTRELAPELEVFPGKGPEGIVGGAGRRHLRPRPLRPPRASGRWCPGCPR